MHVPLYVYGRESMDWTYHLLLLGMRQVVVCDRAPDRARSMDPPATVRCAGRGSWSIAGDSRARSSLPHRLIPIPSHRMMRRRPTQPGSQVADKSRGASLPSPAHSRPAGEIDRFDRGARPGRQIYIFATYVQTHRRTQEQHEAGRRRERRPSS
jgi:hypothetical protein